MILRRKPTPTEPAAPAPTSERVPEPPTLPSILGSSSRFTGEVSGRGDLLIEGSLEGAVRLRGCVQIQPTGRADAGLEVSDLEIRGRLQGNAQVEGLLHAAAGCEVNGSASAARWAVDEGARLEGEFRPASQPTRN